MDKVFIKNLQVETVIGIFNWEREVRQVVSIDLAMEFDNKKAAKIFKSIVKNDPNHVESRFELINVYLALNKSREAKKECEIIYMLDREIYNSIDYLKKRSSSKIIFIVGEIKRKGTAVIIGLLAVSWPDKMEEEPCENKWNDPR